MPVYSRHERWDGKRKLTRKNLRVKKHPLVAHGTTRSPSAYDAMTSNQRLPPARYRTKVTVDEIVVALGRSSIRRRLTFTDKINLA